MTKNKTQIDQNNWWQTCDTNMQEALKKIWVPIGCPGYAGDRKRNRQEYFDQKFGEKCWRVSHIVKGRIVSEKEALQEYEHSYRVYLHAHPEIVRFLVSFCGNIYDYDRKNVFDADYHQPNTSRNHYQDISVRQIIAELVDDVTWTDVTETPSEEVDLIDLTSGQCFHLPRARGFQGNYLLQIRGRQSPGYFLSPAVIPVYDPDLITNHPSIKGWFSEEGCGHLSIESFWQMSKIVEVRYDKFLHLGQERMNLFS